MLLTTRTAPIRLIAGAVFLASSAVPSAAHHAMGSKLPATAFEGVISGLAHPVIGLDHLAFIIAIGILAYLARSIIAVPLVFVATTLLGTAIHLAGLSIPVPELLIALSLIASAAVVLSISKQQEPSSTPRHALFLTLAACGLFHGYAYGESIVGAEQTPLIAYLFGFACIQMLIALAAAGTMQTLFARATPIAATLSRVAAGITIAAVGIVAMIGQTQFL